MRGDGVVLVFNAANGVRLCIYCLHGLIVVIVDFVITETILWVGEETRLF